MNKYEANKEAKNIYDKWLEEKEKIVIEAKKLGIWSDKGLDSNNQLFKKINKETKEKLKKLHSMIDE